MGDMSMGSVPLGRYRISHVGGDLISFEGRPGFSPDCPPSCRSMHFGTLVNKNQRLKALKEGEPEYGRGKLTSMVRGDAC